MMNKILLGISIVAAIVLLPACATPRSNALFGINYSDQPSREVFRGNCNGKDFTTQGTAVCEQKAPSIASVSVKIPPLEGRVVYSNGQLKKTDDFNWYPKDGFFLWKKRPIKDTWIDLDLGEIAATFGDWPVALDVIAVHEKVGVIVTRGLIYHRICNDQDVPCSKLVVKFECAGFQKATAAGEIGKCERMSGSPQAFRVQLKGLGYESKPGAKIYVSAPRFGINGAVYTPGPSEFESGEMKLEPQSTNGDPIPVPNGPSLVGIRLAWIDGGQKKQVETRILVVGFSPEWSGLDQPHWMDRGDKIEFVKPVLSDLLESNLYEGRELKKKAFSSDRVTSFMKPGPGQVACAFAWQRDSSDQTSFCLNEQLQEVRIP